jgi:hypothetical protein
MVRKVLGFSVFMTLACAAFGCGGGYSEERATIRCDQEKAGKPCVTDDSYDACLTCYEECGDQCLPQSTCPETYACKN